MNASLTVIRQILRSSPRRFITRADVLQRSSRKDEYKRRHIVLLSDSILICRRKHGRLQPRWWLHLTPQTRLRFVSPLLVTEFEVIGVERSFVIQCRSERERAIWMLLLDEALRDVRAASPVASSATPRATSSAPMGVPPREAPRGYH